MSDSKVLKKGQHVAATQRRPIPAEPARLRRAPSVPVPVPLPAAVEQELARLRDAARHEGLAQGLAQGREQAQQQARQQAARALEDKLVRVGQLLQTVAAAWEVERQQMHAAVADLVFVAVNRLLADSLGDPAVAVAAVRAALADCGIWQAVTVEVHPQDLAILRQALAGADGLESSRSLQIIGSPDVQLGGCRVRSTGEGLLDARLETQLAQLRLRLDQWRHAREPAA